MILEFDLIYFYFFAHHASFFNFVMYILFTNNLIMLVHKHAMGAGAYMAS